MRSGLIQCDVYIENTHLQYWGRFEDHGVAKVVVPALVVVHVHLQVGSVEEVTMVQNLHITIQV